MAGTPWDSHDTPWGSGNATLRVQDQTGVVDLICLRIEPKIRLLGVGWMKSGRWWLISKNSPEMYNMYLVNFMRAREIHENETRGIHEICKSFFSTRHYSSTHQANPGKTWGRTTEQPEINLTSSRNQRSFQVLKGSNGVLQSPVVKCVQRIWGWIKENIAGLYDRNRNRFTICCWTARTPPSYSKYNMSNHPFHSTGKRGKKATQGSSEWKLLKFVLQRIPRAVLKHAHNSQNLPYALKKKWHDINYRYLQ